MAILKTPAQTIIYLSDHHTFGRLADKVDTKVADAFASRIHAVVYWHAENWKIRDLSSNGTWLNGKALAHNHVTQLKNNDVIQFGSPDAHSYRLVDMAPPKDALICQDPDCPDEGRVLPLSDYQFLPNADAPELIIVKQNNQWQVDKLTPAQHDMQPLSNGELLSFKGQRWQFREVQNLNMTVPVDSCLARPEQAQLHFKMSQDEEHCQLSVTLQGETANLAQRSHHALTLMLARYRAEHYQKNYSPEEQGWVYIEQLSQDLGIEERHINIQIHRARKQICDLFADQLDCASFIERRLGQVRLGFPQFELIKAGTREFSSFVPTTG